MALLDDLTKKAAKFTETAIDKTQEVAETAKIKLKIKNLESDRDDVYRDLGRYYFDLLKDQDQIVLQFKDKNPNGSMEAITSVCDESGLVCAMMPHPERACEEILGSSDGLNFFKGFL